MSDDVSRIQSTIREASGWLLATLVVMVLDRQQLIVPSIRALVEKGLTESQSLVQQGIEMMASPFSYIQSLEGQAERTAQLEQRLKTLTIDYVAFKQLQAENVELKALLGQTKQFPANDKFIAASILKGSNGSMLTKGNRDGVSNGDVVLDPEGVLVGRVILTQAYVSLLERPSEATSHITVKIAGSGITGILVGNGTNAVMEGVLQAENLKEGDVVVTSGTDTAYPPNLVVGVASKVMSEAAEVTKSAIVDLSAQGEAVKIIEMKGNNDSN